MPNLEIKGWGFIHDYGNSFDIEQEPPNPRDFCLELRVDVGEIGKEWVASYQIFVCTPLGLISHFNELSRYAAEDTNSELEYLFGKGLLILREYNVNFIEEAIEKNIDLLKYYAFDLS
jgi:hypothetical protein